MLQLTRNPIEDVLEPIDKALSELVMDVIKNSPNAVEGDTQKLIEALSVLVKEADKVGNTEKGEGHILLPEIVKGVRAVVDAVGLLSVGLKAFVEDSDNVDLQDNVTKYAMELGDVILNLSDLLNECSKIRMYKLLKRATLYLAELERLIKAEPEQRGNLLKVTQACEEINAKLIHSTLLSVNFSKNDKKKVLLNQALDKLEEASPCLIDMSKRIPIPNNTQVATFKTRALQHSFTVASGFNDIMMALKEEEEDHIFLLLRDTLDYINVVIKGAKILSENARCYYEAYVSGLNGTNVGALELSESSVATIDATNGLIENLTKLKEKELDPVKRAFFEQLIWDLEDKLEELDKISRGIEEGSPVAAKRLEEFYNNTISITQRLYKGPEDDANQTEDTTILKTTALTHLPEKELKTSNRLPFLVDTKNTATLVADASNIMDKLISNTQDSNQKDNFMRKKKYLQSQTKSVMLAAESWQSQPTQYNEKLLSTEQDKLHKLMDEIKILDSEQAESSNAASYLSVPSSTNNRVSIIMNDISLLNFSADEIDTNSL